MQMHVFSGTFLLPLLAIQPTILGDDQAGGFGIAVLNIDRVLQFFYIIKHKIFSFLIIHFILCFALRFVKFENTQNRSRIRFKNCFAF